MFIQPEQMLNPELQTIDTTSRQTIAKSPCNLKKTVEVVKKVVNIKSLQ